MWGHEKRQLVRPKDKKKKKRWRKAIADMEMEKPEESLGVMSVNMWETCLQKEPHLTDSRIHIYIKALMFYLFKEAGNLKYKTSCLIISHLKLIYLLYIL